MTSFWLNFIHDTQKSIHEIVFLQKKEKSTVFFLVLYKTVYIYMSFLFLLIFFYFAQLAIIYIHII